MSKISVYVLNKESGHNDRTNKDWYKVNMIPVVAPDFPFLVGKPLDKYVDKETYDFYKVNPLKVVEVDVDVKVAYRAEYADLHLNVNLVEEVAESK